MRAIGHYTQDLLFDSGVLPVESREAETENALVATLDEAYLAMVWCTSTMMDENPELSNLASTMAEFGTLGTKIYEHVQGGEDPLTLSGRDIKNLKSATMVFGAAGTRHALSSSGQGKHAPSSGIMPATTESARQLAGRLDQFVAWAAAAPNAHEA